MIGFSAFKTRKPRQFEYKPRYYDPEQEALQERKREVLGAGFDDGEQGQEYKPGQYIRRQAAVRRTYQALKRRSAGNMLRFALILVGLLLIGAWLLW